MTWGDVLGILCVLVIAGPPIILIFGGLGMLMGKAKRS